MTPAITTVPVNFGFCHARDEDGQHRVHHLPTDAVYNGYPALSCAYCGRWLVRVVAEGDTIDQVRALTKGQGPDTLAS